MIYNITPMIKKDIEVIMKLILERLSNMDKWGGAHTALDNIRRSLPDHLRESKEGNRNIEKAIKSLVNLGFILVGKKRTGKGSDIHISLNTRTKKEIYEFIDKNERKEYL